MWRGALKAAYSSQHPCLFLLQGVCFSLPSKSLEASQSLCPSSNTETVLFTVLMAALRCQLLCIPLETLRNTIQNYSSLFCHHSMAMTWNLNPGSVHHVGWSEISWILTVLHQTSLKCSAAEAQFPSPQNESSCQGDINCVSPPHRQKAFHMLTSGGIHFCTSCFSHQQETLMVFNK